MRRASHRRAPVAAAVVAASLVGCAQESASLRQSFAHPGPAAYQRAQAIHHDPYVLNDVGPEVVGGRPREYMIPVNEVDRARMDVSAPAGLTPPPPPAVVIGPPPGPAPYAPATMAGPPTYPPVGPPSVTTPTPVAPSFPTQQRAPY
jgi:hypothetical protein